MLIIDVISCIQSVSPGWVNTEIVPEYMKKSNMKFLESDDLAEAVLYVLGTPQRVQVKLLCLSGIVGILLLKKNTNSFRFMS